MASYYPAAATAYYPDYPATQPAYQVQPHPYGANYTVNLQPEHYIYPATHRDTSPASSGDHSGGSSSKTHRRRRSSVYLEPNGDRIVVSGGSPSRREREREQRRRDERELERIEKEERREERRRRKAEKAAAATAIPSFVRASTMPTGHTVTPSYETRGRRPILVAEHWEDAGKTSSRIPIGPIEIVEHASRGRDRRYPRSGSERPVTPQGYTSNEEELHRRASQRVRNEEDVRASHRSGMAFSSSAPSRESHMPSPRYSSSYESSRPPTPVRHRRGSSSASKSSTAAVEAATKHLRFADDDDTRRRVQNQNERIRSRPKVRDDAIVSPPNRPLQAELKSILKNSPNNTSTPPTPTSASRPGSSDRRSSRRESISRRGDDLVDGVTRGMAGLSTAEDPEYTRRLADRFSRPTRRHSTFGPGAESRMRTDYDDRRYYS